MLVSGYVRNAATVAVQIDAAFLAAVPKGQDAMSGYTRLLGQLIDPHRFPGLTAVLASGVLDTTDEWDDEFTFGLERVLDGIGALVAAPGDDAPGAVNATCVYLRQRTKGCGALADNVDRATGRRVSQPEQVLFMQPDAAMRNAGARGGYFLVAAARAVDADGSVFPSPASC